MVRGREIKNDQSPFFFFFANVTPPFSHVKNAVLVVSAFHFSPAPFSSTTPSLDTPGEWHIVTSHHGECLTRILPTCIKNNDLPISVYAKGGAQTSSTPFENQEVRNETDKAKIAARYYNLRHTGVLSFWSQSLPHYLLSSCSRQWCSTRRSHA